MLFSSVDGVPTPDPVLRRSPCQASTVRLTKYNITGLGEAKWLILNARVTACDPHWSSPDGVKLRGLKGDIKR